MKLLTVVVTGCFALLQAAPGCSSSKNARVPQVPAYEQLDLPEYPGPTLTTDHVLHVDLNHSNGSDTGTGLASEPFKSISAAAKKAVALKKIGESSTVLVHPGTYRETVKMDSYTNYKSNQPDNKTPIQFMASKPGAAIISGSDIVEWTRESAGTYTTPWSMNWGVYPNPTRNVKEVPDIVRRAEVVFVDGNRMDHAMTPDYLVPGSYLVDDTAGKITLKLPEGTNFDNALIEVATREELWKQEHESHVSIRGFVFQHAATRWADAVAAIRIAGGSDVRFEDSDVVWNNGRGIYFTDIERVALARVRMNHNGWDGWGTWKVKEFSAEDCETNYNNWRGHMGGYYVWSVGNKLLTTHGLVLRRHKAVGNFSRGLWLDLDNTDVLFDDVTVDDNLSDGIFIEANQGPIRIINSSFSGNDQFGILSANSEKVTIENTRLVDNVDGAFHITGQRHGRPVTNFETGEKMKLWETDWTLNNNTISGGLKLLTATLDDESWEKFVASYKGSGNEWSHPDSEPFTVPMFSVSRLKIRTNISFEDWQKETGQDADSRFVRGG